MAEGVCLKSIIVDNGRIQRTSLSPIDDCIVLRADEYRPVKRDKYPVILSTMEANHEKKRIKG